MEVREDGGIKQNSKSGQQEGLGEHNPQCCGKPMQAAKMMTATGKVRGMMWLCDKCWKESKIV